MKYTVMVKKRVVVNDDPHNRCYNGAFLDSHTETLEHAVCTYCTPEDAQQAMATFSAINPGREYRIEVKQ